MAVCISEFHGLPLQMVRGWQYFFFFFLGSLRGEVEGFCMQRFCHLWQNKISQHFIQASEYPMILFLPLFFEAHYARKPSLQLCEIALACLVLRKVE